MIKIKIIQFERLKSKAKICSTFRQSLQIEFYLIV